MIPQRMGKEETIRAISSILSDTPIPPLTKYESYALGYCSFALSYIINRTFFLILAIQTTKTAKNISIYLQKNTQIVCLFKKKHYFRKKLKRNIAQNES